MTTKKKTKQPTNTTLPAPLDYVNYRKVVRSKVKRSLKLLNKHSSEWIKGCECYTCEALGLLKDVIKL